MCFEDTKLDLADGRFDYRAAVRSQGQMLVGIGVAMRMPMRMSVTVFMRGVGMRMFMVVIAGKVNVELHSFNAGFVAAGHVQMIAFERQLFQFARQLIGIHAEIDQCADEHIAADAAENIQIQGLHKVRLFVYGVINPCAA